MGFDWKDFFHRHRAQIIDEWSSRLGTEVSPQYAKRPKEELLGTVAQSFDANYHAITNGDYGRINRFINDITKMRLAGGFSANDVLKAFELFRNIVVPLLYAETSSKEFFECLLKVNECMAYTVECFSNLFQELYNHYLLNYTKRLEADVRARTSELLESELKYKTLIEEMNDGYVVIKDDVIVFVNQAFCDMHGFALGEMLGKRFDQLVDTRDRQMFATIYNRDDPTEKRFSPLEYYRLTRDGKSLPTEITVKTTRYDNHRSTIGICRDITERVLMEEKVREAEHMAYIGRITTSLSHEIRNPLSAVKMNLQILEKNLTLQGNDRRRLEISARAVHRLERVLEELLDFAKPLTLNRIACNLNQILPSCIELLDGKLEEKHLPICIALDPAMPDIFADSHKLEQAILNLLLNAAEASKPQERIWVSSSYHKDTDPPRVGFSIANEAVIDADVLSEIFKPFFTTKFGGTGLGLTNVKHIAEAHGGNVLVESGEKGGTVFSVLLPVGGIHG